MILELCSAAGVPIWYIDVLQTRTGKVDFGLIKDEANEAAQNRGPRVEVHLLGENLADTAEQAQGADRAASEPTDTTPVEFSPGTRRALSSSRSTPSPALVSIARVQKIESRIATVLHYIQP